MSSIQYRPNLDGLRAVAVLSVCIYHLNPHLLPGGFVGVDIFFVLSGYLITLVLLTDPLENLSHLSRFYQRRIARILPASFVAALLIILAATLIYQPKDLSSAGQYLFSSSLSIINFKLMRQGGYFVASPDTQPYLHYWSLAVEEQFYLLFPTLLLITFKTARRFALPIFATLFLLSLASCIWLTPIVPAATFYLLPTRAWELLAGCVLAIRHSTRPIQLSSTNKNIAAALGILLLALSLIFIQSDQHFPGFVAIFPVLGTCLLILPPVESATLTRFLAAKPLVLIGRVSYSIYLWHWPVYSFTDYALFNSTPATRLILKIAITALGSAFSYALIEKPSRKFLNHPNRRPIAFGTLAIAILICAPLGRSIRDNNYVNAYAGDVRKGGLVFNFGPPSHTVILMGDSNASMYGKAVKEICAEQHLRLIVISVAGGDILPYSDGHADPLWANSLAVIAAAHPDCVLCSIRWDERLDKDENRDQSRDQSRLAIALRAIEPLTKNIILFTQPPLLPDNATREGIRSGARPPFREDPAISTIRLRTNTIVQSFASPKIRILDVASVFQLPDNAARFFDSDGRLLYSDPHHLSDDGINLIRPQLQTLIAQTTTATTTQPSATNP